MSKPVKWSEIHDPDVVEARWTQVSQTSEFGRSTVTIRCPFCEALVTAYQWSLSGGGKRCQCGAMIGAYGMAYGRREDA